MSGSAAIDIGAFRRAAARYATGVAVVSARTGSHDHAITVNSFTTVSLDPSLVLFCVERDARFHDAVEETGHFGVSVLAAEHRPVAAWLATPGRPVVGQLETIAHEHGPGGCVLISGALAHFEAEVTAIHPAGDHSIIVGSVTYLDAPDEPPDALLYVRSRFERHSGA